MRQKMDKGKLLEIGLQGRRGETKREILKNGLVLLIGGLFLLYLSYSGYEGSATIFGSTTLAFIFPLLVAILFFLIFFFVPGVEIDAIYENGITYRWVNVIKKIQGKEWIPWEEVEKVYYGKFDFEDERGISEYVRIIAGDKDTRPFIKSQYEKHSPNFYPLLVKMLKEKCPQAKWIKKDE